MSPNIRHISCACNFYATLLKDKSPVYHLFRKAGCLLKVVAYMEGTAGSLKEHYPITAH